jgi:hypothetical protein
MEDVVVRPYDLIKTPFAHKGKRVILDVVSYPFLVDDNFMRYVEPSFGREGIARGWECVA